jgi:penicillin amidase
MKFALIIRRALTLAAALVAANITGFALGQHERAQAPESVGVEGLHARVEMVRDRHGVPHVRAKNETDAHFGLGFVHAQDRLWQMEFQRRLGNGRLAEILGEKLLPTDRLFRTLGLRRTAAAAWARFNAEERRPFEAYVAGVNAYLASRHGGQLPPEFLMLGVEPEPWRPEDVLVWGKVVAWGLSGNWDKELLRARLAAKVGPERAAQLMPAYTADGPTILPSPPQAAEDARGASDATTRPALIDLDASVVDGLLELNRTVEALTGLGADGFGSNNWVLSGARTTTGRPLLAGDPHLTAQTPSIWYLARVSGGPLDVIGATIPGSPGVYVGHNGHIAWSPTTINVDSQDLYVEHINERDEAEFAGAWEPLTVVPETIKVKGRPDVDLKVRITRHGPVISDVINPAGQPLAFRWTANDPVDAGVLATLGYNRARNWKQFNEATRANRPGDQNYVYADRHGNIGYVAAATIPVRPAGDDGRLPVPGWTGQHEWAGYVPFDELPRAYNPPQGYIASANNKVAGDDYPHLIGTNFAAPYRAARVVEMIDSRKRHSPGDMARMQSDVLALHAREVLPFMLKTEPADERGRQAVELLRGWDMRVNGDSARAAVFEAWYLKLGERLFADELRDPVAGDALWRAYSENIYMVGMALEAALEEDAAWCDDVRTPAVETCADALASSLAEGLAKMNGAQGTDDVAAWRWDRAHHALFPHAPFDADPQLKPVFSRSIPNGGDKFTVNVASIFLWEDYNQSHAAMYRQVVDFADLENSRFIVAPGQSGDPESPHYDDLLGRWQRVEYLPMRFDRKASDGAADERLVLEP